MNTTAAAAKTARLARLEEAAKILGATFMKGETVVSWYENGEFKARGGMTGRGASELVKMHIRSMRGTVTGSHADRVI